MITVHEITFRVVMILHLLPRKTAAYTDIQTSIILCFHLSKNV